MDYDSERSTAWDGRQKYIEELSAIRRQIHNARINKDINLHHDLLVSFFMALIARIDRFTKKSKTEENPDYRLQIDYKIKSQELINEYNADHQKNRRFVKMKELYNIFDSWEIVLRQKENELGLLMPDGDNPEEAILR